MNEEGVCRAAPGFAGSANKKMNLVVYSIIHDKFASTNLTWNLKIKEENFKEIYYTFTFFNFFI